MIINTYLRARVEPLRGFRIARGYSQRRYPFAALLPDETIRFQTLLAWFPQVHLDRTTDAYEINFSYHGQNLGNFVNDHDN
jgi:hypothetical protein